MKKLLLLLLVMVLCNGCFATSKISRTYNIYIAVDNGSTVTFSPEVLAEVIKDAETKTDQKTDAALDADVSIIP